jgi:hypothetical protein
MNYSIKKIILIERKDHIVIEFKKGQKLEYIMWSIYRELYKNSYPSVDFDILFMKAKRNQFNQKDINYLDYSIKEELFNEITEKIFKKFKLKKHEKETVSRSVLLGCSPRFLKKDECPF